MTSNVLVLENRFDASPRFVKAWLTDFREDDGRFFGDKHAFRVERRGHVITREQSNDMGKIAMTVDVKADDHWVVDGAQRSADGNLLFSFRIRESVRAVNFGTLHRVELTIEPAPALAPMLPQLMEGWRATLTRGFAMMASEIALAAASGKDATA